MEEQGLGGAPKEELTEEQKLIRETLEQLTQNRTQPQPEVTGETTEEIEVPEEIEEPGVHSVQEMGVLARIGKGTRTFELAGNIIQLRTLKQGEELEILSRINSFPESSRNRAYVVYTTAVAIELVNGKPYFERLPLGPNDDIYSHKFKHFLNDMYPTVINAIIDEYQKLRQEMEDRARYAKKE